MKKENKKNQRKNKEIKKTESEPVKKVEDEQSIPKIDSDKFKFVEQEIEENFLIEDEEPTKDRKKEKSEEELSPEERKRKARKKLAKKLLISNLLMILLSGAIIGFSLLWQAKYDLKAIHNALFLAGLIELWIAWMMFMYNKTIFAPLFHGLKTLGLMFVGKRPKDDYYTYTQKIKQSPINKFYLLLFLIWGLLLIVPALFMLIPLLK